ncbi:MAG: DUF4402 domain-containing protein [Rhodospirillales bacterium]|nr:MAG: DUF4402 domain-containing protein [Rhodospirillales bacterium]
MKFTKRISTLAAGVAALGVAGLGSTSAMAAQDQVNANATIVDAIGITGDRSLEFGTIINGAANTVTIANTAAGTRSATDPTQLLLGGGEQSAQFTVSGDPGRSYNLTVPPSITVTETGGTTMTVNNIQHSATGTLDGVTGNEVFYVGGDLIVTNGQLAGTYSGTLLIQVDY